MAFSDGRPNDDARALTATRVYDAPRELVFDMWTNPEHVSNWWGPRGFTTTTKSMDLRPGGLWLFTMHGPDGTDYPNEVVYHEVKRPSRLHYTHGPVPKFDVTVTFEEEGDKTRVNFRSVFESAELLEKLTEDVGAVEGLHNTMDRFGEQLALRSPFVISRTFDAPRELMFRVWTDCDHLQHWFGPKGTTIFHCTNDLRPGGIMHYGMRTDDGGEMWGRWVYREITPPRQFVFVVSFSDPSAEITRTPFGDAWPLEWLSLVTFDEENGRTKVTVNWAPINATEEERKVFDSNHASMTGGWTGTFQQLEEYLRQL